VVVQACKFIIFAVILMLGDSGGGLVEQETSKSVVNSKPNTKKVLDRDNIWSIFLNVEQFHGGCLGDRCRIVVML
jgi:hypothetical protein